MRCNESSDLEIKQGKTFRRVLRWEAAPIIYKAISAITKGAPVSITATGHGIPNGWRATVVSVKGMDEINAKSEPPANSDYKQVTVKDGNTIELNSINSSDFSTYKGGGYLQFNTPVDMTGYTARMAIKNAVGGTELALLTTENDGIVIDNTAKKISLFMSAEDTEEITWNTGVYELEMISSGGEVTSLISGTVNVIKEITT